MLHFEVWPKAAEALVFGSPCSTHVWFTITSVTYLFRVYVTTIKIHHLTLPIFVFNPRPAGPLDFPPPAGGGAVVETPPLSQLLGHVATRGKRNSKERHKS